MIFYPTRDLALRRLFWGGWRCWSLGDREPLWSHAEKQAPNCQRAVRQHRRLDHSSYSSVGRFPHHQLHGTQQQSSLPIKTQRRSIARTYVHAPEVITTPALAALFHARIRYLPETKTTATPTTIHIPLLPAEAPGLACILHFIFRTYNSGTEEK